MSLFKQSPLLLPLAGIKTALSDVLSFKRQGHGLPSTVFDCG